MKYFYLFLCCLLLISASQAGVYGELEFGDSRETVTKKLSQSPLVEQTIDNTYTARTGLNGIFKCKGKISELTFHLYFNWDEQGGLNEITLRSEGLDVDLYKTRLQRAWSDAESLFTQVYEAPAQQATYPALSSFKKHKMMISHVWGNKGKETILMGTGIDKNQCFLFIRYVRAQVELQREE